MFPPSLEMLSHLAGETPAWVPGGELEVGLSAQPGAPWDACRADKLAPFVTTHPSAAERRRLRQQRRRRRTARARRTFSAAAQRQLLAMIAVGVSQREAAASLGFSHSTISKAQQRDTDFAASLRRAAVQGLHSQRWRRQLASLGTSANPLGQASGES